MSQKGVEHLSSILKGFKYFWDNYGESKPLVALLGLFIVSSFASPAFLTRRNQEILLLQSAPAILLALGETLVILVGSIDLSVGSILGLSSMLAGMALGKWGYPTWLAVLICLIVGLVLGTINGLLVAYGKIPSFIATLAMLVAARGSILIISGGFPVGGLTGLRPFTSKLLGLPLMVWIAIALTFIVCIVTFKFKVGRRIYAVGGSDEAAYRFGINVKLVRFAVFVVSGLFAALAGLMIAARLEMAYTWAGWGYELDAIAAAVVGGVSFTGGVGSPVGAVMGAYLLTGITNILLLMEVDPYWQWVVKGIILCFAAIPLTKGLRFVR